MTKSNIKILSKEDISIDLVGEKAYGLSCIPKNWTLPFIVLSKEFVSSKTLTKFDIENIIIALEKVHFAGNDIIIRSSGCVEGLEERGQLYSSDGKLEYISNVFLSLLELFYKDKKLDTNNIPLIIQKHIAIYSEKGHLSNERRVKKDPRDWMLEIEDFNSHDTISSIAIRNWRDETSIVAFTNKPLYCVFENRLKNVLRIVAKWGFEFNKRLHFEWVWDHYNIYIVQADQEKNINGIDPTKQFQNFRSMQSQKLNLIEQIEDRHAIKYPKIDNVLIYRKLELPSVPLYILEDQAIINKLSKDELPEQLKKDLEELLQEPLIIRTDIASADKSKRQMLPRDEKRDLDSTVKWLQETSKTLLADSKLHNIDIAFIFHNFIPAVSSAFAYAKPNDRNVQVESLWGLPEGLYFFAHDKHVIDTKNNNIDKISLDSFEVKSKEYYKNFFVVPNSKGKWSTEKVAVPYDWKESIQNNNWIKKIALHSRKIAENVGKPLSIMWFVNVPQDICPEYIFPWHHETFTLQNKTKNKKNRTKTPHDELLTIRTSEDLLILEKETNKENSFIKKINIQPMDDALLRDKDTLQKIGLYAKKLNAFVILEGSLLSHAYYQLKQTGAIVETYHGFENFEDTQEFNKLVRDKIPENIESGGESVNVIELEQESIIRALKDKLIEESYEVFDATQEELLGELADVYEVMDGLLHHLNIKKEDVLKKQAQKREKVGGFKEGLVLLETKNLLLPHTENIQPTLFNEDEISPSKRKYENIPSQEFSQYRDKRDLSNSEQNIIRFSIPYTTAYWTTTMNEMFINKQNFDIKVSGKRIDSSYQIEIDIFSKKNTSKQKKFEF
ncbi:hypothetical protein [Sulfurimonas sp.]|uniref:hypothetical protein n=1 Tax=Sulfurimonas sp. TaxID=2022749 RepID=UPI003D137251